MKRKPRTAIILPATHLLQYWRITAVFDDEVRAGILVLGCSAEDCLERLPRALAEHTAKEVATARNACYELLTREGWTPVQMLRMRDFRQAWNRRPSLRTEELSRPGV